MRSHGKIGEAMNLQSKTSPKAPAGTKRLLSVSAVLIVIVGLLFLSLYLLVGTQITGTEFSPQTFQTRTFSYRRIPGTKIRLSATVLGTASSRVTKPVLQHLTAPTSNPRWDILQVTAGAESEQRPPSILQTLLEAPGVNSNCHWDEWSTAHPELAKVFWPIVQQQAIDSHYAILPELCEIAMNSDSPESLKSQCDDAIANYLRNIGETPNSPSTRP